MISLNKVSNSRIGLLNDFFLTRFRILKMVFFDDFIEGGEEAERAEGVEGASKSRPTCGQH